MNRQLFRVTLPYACFGVYVFDGRVVETAPIFKWALYKNWNEAQKWISSKGGRIEEMK
jgi:hypothetical protein